MAMSVQCPRESRALHSDYYSTTKKAATPLNEVCIAALHATSCVHTSTFDARHAARDETLRRIVHDFFRPLENADSIWIFKDSFWAEPMIGVTRQ